MASQVAEAGADARDVERERLRIVYEQLEQVEALARGAVRAICDAIPMYAAQDSAFITDVVDQTAKNYRANLTMFLEDRVLTLDDIAFVRGAAMRRARAGMPLEDYLNAYRVGQQFLWEAIVASAADSPVGQQVALSLATEVLQYTNFASTHAGHAYVEFQQYAIADADRERRDLLEHLLAGKMPSRGPLVARTRAYGIEAVGPSVIAVGIPVDPEVDTDALHAASATIARLSHCSLRSLVVLRQAEIIAVQALGPRGDAGELCDRVDLLQQELASDGLQLAIGISTIADSVAELPRAYLEARSAVELVTTTGGLAALPRMSPFDYLARRGVDTAARLIDPRIRRFLDEDRHRGGSLIATIRALAEANLNMRVAAERLYVHTNTAHYRVRRIQERTGRNPRRVADLFELLVAIALHDAQAARS